MPFLENATDYADNDQLTVANLNALTESTKPVKNGAGVTNSGNTTDETSCNINSSGEIEVKDAGITTAKINDGAVTNAKLADAAVGASKLGALSVTNAKLQPNSVAGSGTGATGTNKIEAGSIGFADLNDDIITGEGAHSDSGAGSIPQDTDLLLAYDASAAARVTLSLEQLSRHAVMPKAYGVIGWDGSAALSGEYNLGTPSDASPTTVSVQFTNPMADANYVVVVTFQRSAVSDDIDPAQVVSRTSSGFTLGWRQGKTSGLALHVAVFGTLGNL